MNINSNITIQCIHQFDISVLLDYVDLTGSTRRHVKPSQVESSTTFSEIPDFPHPGFVQSFSGDFPTPSTTFCGVFSMTFPGPCTHAEVLVL